jgi:hypothetical protein
MCRHLTDFTHFFHKIVAAISEFFFELTVVAWVKFGGVKHFGFSAMLTVLEYGV